jgi:hypothetical protein
VWPATFPPGESSRLFAARRLLGVGRAVSSEDELESRTCPVCRRKMKLARVGGHPKVSTYQCLSCKEVMTVEDWTGSGSYFQGAALFVGRAGEQALGSRNKSLQRPGASRQRPGSTKAFGLAAVRRFAQRRPQYPTGACEPVIGPLPSTGSPTLAKFPANSLQIPCSRKKIPASHSKIPCSVA